MWWAVDSYASRLHRAEYFETMQRALVMLMASEAFTARELDEVVHTFHTGHEWDGYPPWEALAEFAGEAPSLPEHAGHHLHRAWLDEVSETLPPAAEQRQRQELDRLWVLLELCHRTTRRLSEVEDEVDVRGEHNLLDCATGCCCCLSFRCGRRWPTTLGCLLLSGSGCEAFCKYGGANCTLREK
jgi:hypothetical protein